MAASSANSLFRGSGPIMMAKFTYSLILISPSAKKQHLIGWSSLWKTFRMQTETGKLQPWLLEQHWVLLSTFCSVYAIASTQLLGFPLRFSRRWSPGLVPRELTMMEVQRTNPKGQNYVVILHQSSRGNVAQNLHFWSQGAGRGVRREGLLERWTSKTWRELKVQRTNRRQ